MSCERLVCALVGHLRVQRHLLEFGYAPPKTGPAALGAWLVARDRALVRLRAYDMTRLAQDTAGALRERSEHPLAAALQAAAERTSELAQALQRRDRSVARTLHSRLERLSRRLNAAHTARHARERYTGG